MGMFSTLKESYGAAKQAASNPKLIKELEKEGNRILVKTHNDAIDLCIEQSKENNCNCHILFNKLKKENPK